MRPAVVVLATVLLTLTGAAARAASAPAASPFASWAAVVISGDDMAAHADTHTEAFDNARRDLGAALVRRGFSAANMAEYSVEAGARGDATPGPARLDDIAAGMRRLAARARSGCLFYLTSHGSPNGAVLGAKIVAPRTVARLVGRTCAGRPTVVVISACYSGVFIPALARPNRLILTAARPDRSSFGCGESDRYPYFDGCVLETLPASADFLDLANRTRACVARRERQEGMSPPSDPQISVGTAFHSPPFAAAG